MSNPTSLIDITCNSAGHAEASEKFIGSEDLGELSLPRGKGTDAHLNEWSNKMYAVRHRCEPMNKYPKSSLPRSLRLLSVRLNCVGP